MSDQQTLAPEEVSRRITVGMGMVHDLFNEMVPFFRAIHGGLEASDLEVDLIALRSFKMPLGPKKERSPADSFLARDMGFLMELGVSAGEPDEEEEDAEDEEESDSGSSAKGRQITPESKFLAVRARLYDPVQAQSNNFAPEVVAAIFSDIVRQPGKRSQTKALVRDPVVRQAGLLRLAKRLHGGLKPGQTVEARAKLAATVSTLITRPLAQFDGEEKVDQFVQDLVAMASDA